MLIYCKTRTEGLSQLGCLDALQDIQDGIKGVSELLPAASDGPEITREQLHVCANVLTLAFDALVAIKEGLSAEAVICACK